MQPTTHSLDRRRAGVRVALALALLPGAATTAGGCHQAVDEGTAFISGSSAEAGESSGGSMDETGTEGGGGDGSGSGASTDTGDGGDTSGDSGVAPDVADSGGTQTSGTTGGSDCGNGMIDQGEQCDMLNLNGFTCTQLGYGGGDLLCDPITCTYDTSGCIPDMGGTSG